MEPAIAVPSPPAKLQPPDFEEPATEKLVQDAFWEPLRHQVQDAPQL